MIKYSDQKPPNWEEIKKAFPAINWDNGIIITYGDTYYSKKPTTPDLIVHEETHMRQQLLVGGPDVFFKKYVDDKNFRLEMELEAYKNQLQYIRNNLMSAPRQKRVSILRQYKENMAELLSGNIYGGIITYVKALELIS